jgi:hypothetical protein
VRSGWRGEIFLSGEKGTLGDFLWQIGGFGGHRRAWRGKRPPKFSGKSLWREGTEVVASQYFLVNQTPAKYGVASQNLAWLFVAGIQTAPSCVVQFFLSSTSYVVDAFASKNGQSSTRWPYV